MQNLRAIGYELLNALALALLIAFFTSGSLMVAAYRLGMINIPLI